MKPLLLDHRGNPIQAGEPQPRSLSRTIRAQHYDAAATTDDNVRHWQYATALDADAANTHAVRQTLRQRARYETANNSYARGIVNSLANHTIGTGPRANFQAVGGQRLSRLISDAFADWSRKIHLADKLRTLRKAKAVDGEAFALLVTNPRTRHPVTLDLRPIEADHIHDPNDTNQDPRNIDGVFLDRHGNPNRYRILKTHPGARGTLGAAYADYIDRPADQVLHLFAGERPGQHRGVPELMPALPLFSQLRRYTLAVIAAAETAADFAGVIKTNGPADESPEAIAAMDAIELERRALLTLPRGWDMGQIKAEQPTTTYGEFKRQIINEIARALNMPLNVALGDSSGYNYSSGRLDHQEFRKTTQIERHLWECCALDPIVDAWIDEAALAGVIPPATTITGVTWYWDGHEHVDPLKEGNAEAVRLAAHTTTLAELYGRQGRDWREALNQRAEELALMEELGIAQPAPAATPAEEPADA